MSVPKNPVIRGVKVWLRPASADDAVHWSNATQDRDLAHFAGFPVPEDVMYTRQKFETHFASAHGDRNFFFMICPLGSEDVLGMIGMHSYDKRNSSAELGVFISDPHERGHGYGSDAINALLDYGFGELPMERIYLHVYSFNERAFALYKELGFTHEGTLRRAWRHRGKLHDVHVMAILRDEWQGLTRPKAWELDDHT